MSEVPIADNHVHSQWSWDADDGSMEESCRRAAELGLPAIAFTEHADWIRGREGVFDCQGYFESIERCRAAFPGLRILSGVELGEPHRYPEEARALLALPFDRVLASVHCVEWNGERTDACEEGFLTPADAGGIFRVYLREVLALLESDQPFQVLAHLDYPKRYWPSHPAYLEAQYEEEFRAILHAAALREVTLEVNTTRGGDHARHLCPGPVVVKWWREEGGRSISFGSDAHSPDAVAAGFELARELVVAAGFKPQGDPAAFWFR
jgi:histidinol-phosphatase (PHP family)